MNTITVTSGRILHDKKRIHAVAIVGYDRERKEWVAYLEDETGDTKIRRTPTREEAQNTCATAIEKARTRMRAVEPPDEARQGDSSSHTPSRA